MPARKYKPEGDISECDLVRESSSASAEEAKRVREKLKADPHDLGSRFFLLARARPSSDTYAKHLGWLIENHPKQIAHEFISPSAEHPAYQACKPLWLEQIRRHPDDVTALLHAAHFFGTASRETSVRLLQKAALLDPFDDDIPRRLSFVYYLMAGYNSARKNKALAKKSVEQLKIAIERCAVPNEEDSYLLGYFWMVLSDVANLALALDLIDEAKELGHILMRNHEIFSKRLPQLASHYTARMFGHSTHLGYSILGRANIAAGDIDGAKEQLQLMQQHLPISAWRMDFRLVDELLQVGEHEAVIEYLECCSKACEPETQDRDREDAKRKKVWIDQWVKSIRREAKKSK